VRSGVGDYARDEGLSLGIVSKVKLAVSEVVTNAIVHGYRGQPGTITVRAEVDDRLMVTVIDHGGGFLPRDESPGIGAGLQVVRKLAASLEIGTPPGDNGNGAEVRMTFPLAATACRASISPEPRVPLNQRSP